MKIAIDYLLVFSHFWFATPQLVLQADWQEVWHSPQPPFLALSHRLRVSRVLILSIICISDLLNSNGFPGGPPADSHLKTGKILAYHPHKVKIFQQFATNLPRICHDFSWVEGAYLYFQAAKRDTQSLRIAIRFLPTPLYKLWQTENLHAALHLINTSSNTNERTWLA